MELTKHPMILVIGYYKTGKQHHALLACGHTKSVPRTSVQDMCGGKRLCTQQHSIQATVYHEKLLENRER